MATGIVLGGKLNCRKEPKDGAAVYGQFSTGDAITVTAYDSTWWKTSWNGSIGYVKRDFVAIALDTVQVTGTSVNVRNEPSTSGTTVLYRLSSPTKAEVHSVQKDWLYIKPADQDFGWINASYVKKVSDTSSGGGNTGGSTPTLIKTFSGNTKGTDVNVRKLPTTASEVVFTFLVGYRATFNTFSGVGTTDQQRSWLYTDYTQHKGYVYGPYVTAPMPSSGSGVKQISGNSVRLRVLPINGEVITTLSDGCKVLVLDDSVPGWTRVVTQSEGSGWVSNDFIANL